MASEGEAPEATGPSSSRTAPDRLFSDPRLAEVYDTVDGDRDDLTHYVSIAEELSARSVLDLGCGTGNLACALARRGLSVTAVDPAAASLEVARQKPGAAAVRWVHGRIEAALPTEVDLVTMTGNVAQVFTDDSEWYSVLRSCRAVLGLSGHLVFEARNPERAAWFRWTPDATRRLSRLPTGERLTTWVEVTEVALPLVSFRSYFLFEKEAAPLISTSTICFRQRDEIEHWLGKAGFVIKEVRDAPDRPGLEFVFVAGPGA